MTLMRLVDICVNLANSQFRDDRPALLERALSAGVSHMLLTATTVEEARLLLEWCEPPRRFTTAGVHPHDAASVAEDWLDQLTDLVQDDRVRAVGETGLDYNRNFSPVADQRQVFQAQISLAQQVNKPLFVHDRDSDGEVFELLDGSGDLPATVIHCFTGSDVDLQRYLKRDFYIGITGWVADQRRGGMLRELVKRIPLDRLLLETDAPFLRPHNAPADAVNKRRNEPALLTYVLAAIATARGEPIAEIAAQTTANADRVFGFSA